MKSSEIFTDDYFSNALLSNLSLTGNTEATIIILI